MRFLFAIILFLLGSVLIATTDSGIGDTGNIIKNIIAVGLVLLGGLVVGKRRKASFANGSKR